MIQLAYPIEGEGYEPAEPRVPLGANLAGPPPEAAVPLSSTVHTTTPSTGWDPGWNGAAAQPAARTADTAKAPNKNLSLHMGSEAILRPLPDAAARWWNGVWGYSVAMATGAKRGRPRLTDEQRAEQRASLLTGSMEAIRKHGSEVSIDDISREVGVSKPVLYGHFGDRLGLADAIAVAMADDVTGAASRQVEVAASEPLGRGNDQIDFGAAAEVIVTSLVDLVENESEIYGFLVRTIRSGDRGFFDNALVEVIRERGGALVEAANPDIAPELRGVLVDGAFGFLLFSIESWAQRGAPSRAQLERTLTDVVVNGFNTAARNAALVD